MTITQGELRDLLEEAEIDITASAWPAPGYVVAGGSTIVPTLLPGVLIVDYVPVYSEAWL